MTRNIDKLVALDLDRLQEVLDYDPETGFLTWLVRLSPRGNPGERAGTVMPDGYRRIGLDGATHLAHHLAWFHFYGEPAESEIDFKNLDKDDTRIGNLRLATPAENSRNRGASRINPTGLKGVHKFNNPRNKKQYRSSIRVEGKKIHLGLFSTPEEAYKAYCKAAKRYHGEFARTK